MTQESPERTFDTPIVHHVQCINDTVNISRRHSIKQSLKHLYSLIPRIQAPIKAKKLGLGKVRRRFKLRG